MGGRRVTMALISWRPADEAIVQALPDHRLTGLFIFHFADINHVRTIGTLQQLHSTVFKELRHVLRDLFLRLFRVLNASTATLTQGHFKHGFVAHHSLLNEVSVGFQKRNLTVDAAHERSRFID